jgi:hypothetical protein
MREGLTTESTEGTEGESVDWELWPVNDTLKREQRTALFVNPVNLVNPV